MVAEIQRADFGRVYFFSHKFEVIIKQDPIECCEEIQWYGIDKLIFVEPSSFLSWAQSKQRILGNIIIKTFDIGIRVMDNIMFYFPEECASSHQVTTNPCDYIV